MNYVESTIAKFLYLVCKNIELEPSFINEITDLPLDYLNDPDQTIVQMLQNRSGDIQDTLDEIKAYWLGWVIANQPERSVIDAGMPMPATGTITKIDVINLDPGYTDTSRLLSFGNNRNPGPRANKPRNNKTRTKRS